MVGVRSVTIGGMKVVVRCPAKVNLFLAVGPKDRRGYHPLRTVFQAIGLFDTVTLDTDSAETVITSDWEGMPVENTVSKALRLLSELLTLPPLAIHIAKEIPAQSGLGGGSSDAAGLIRGVNRIMGNSLPEHEQRFIARAVGADVPFFLVGGRARAEGYGDKLTPLDDPATQWLVLAKSPAEWTSTAAAYQALDANPYPWREFGDPAELYNDFERVADCQVLDRIERLRVLGATGAGLSGSGSAVFGIFESEEAAVKGREKLLEGETGLEAWAVPTLSRLESLRVLT